MALSTSVHSVASQMMLEQAAPGANIAPKLPMMTPSAATLAPTQPPQVRRIKTIAQTAHLAHSVALPRRTRQALALTALIAQRGQFSAMSMAAQQVKLPLERLVPRQIALIALLAPSAVKARKRLTSAMMRATSAHLVQQKENTVTLVPMSTRPLPCLAALAVARLAPLVATALALEAK